MLCIHCSLWSEWSTPRFCRKRFSSSCGSITWSQGGRDGVFRVESYLPPPSPPFFLMSPWVFSCHVCAHPIIRKCFIVYVPIAHHVFLFLRRRALTEQESRASCLPLYFQSLEEFLAEGNCLGSTISNSSKCFLARDTNAPKREVTRLRSHIVERPEPVLPGNGCHRRRLRSVIISVSLTVPGPVLPRYEFS